MSEIIERVARAIAGHLWPHTSEEAKQCYRDRARHVVAALREPTDAMIRAGSVAVGASFGGDFMAEEFECHAEAAFPAMIDEALK